MHPVITWIEHKKERTARWRAENGTPPPKRVQLANDTMPGDVAYRLACEGVALLWRGDFHNARQLLQAMARRADAKVARAAQKKAAAQREPVTVSAVDAFNLHRQAQSQRARTLGMLLIPFASDYSIPLDRAPDVRIACGEAWGLPEDKSTEGSVTSLRELQGIIGAYEWRRKGVEIATLGERVHPHYGVFAPIRSEYIGLVAEAPLPDPAPALAFDVGTGTGVLALVLAKRGIPKIIATDIDPRALASARENIMRLGFDDQVSIADTDMFPAGRAGLIVCNPPWLPARPSSTMERAIYDQDSAMLRGFLTGLAAHLEAKGEGWLILSDLAEHLGLRSRDTLMEWIAAAGLEVAGRLDAQPNHPRAKDTSDPLHAARAKEVTSLWRLRAKA